MNRSEAEPAIRRWFAAALRAVDPCSAVVSNLTVDHRSITIGNHSVAAPRGVFVVAVGKAAAPMMRGALDTLGDVAVGGVVITKDGHLDGELPPGIETFETSHPIPDHRCVAATERLLTRLGEFGRGHVVLALISGGGSALMESPLDGVDLVDLAATTGLLLRAGAPIQDLNAVRVPLSKVKGGGLRAAAPEARFVSLLLSDVLGNDPSVIASGPTVPTRFDGPGALAVLDRYQVTAQTPPSVLAALHRAADTPPGTLFEDDIVEIVGDNRIAVEAFAGAAGAEMVS